MSQKSVKLSDLDARFREGVSALQTLKNLAPDAATAMAEKLYSSFLFKLFDADVVEYDKPVSDAGKLGEAFGALIGELCVNPLARTAAGRKELEQQIASIPAMQKLAVTKDGDLEFKGVPVKPEDKKPTPMEQAQEVLRDFGLLTPLSGGPQATPELMALVFAMENELPYNKIITKMVDEADPSLRRQWVITRALSLANMKGAIVREILETKYENWEPKSGDEYYLPPYASALADYAKNEILRRK